jgi:GDP-mannose pyrophosphatase NudK
MDDPVKVVSVETLSASWGVLKRTTIEVVHRNGARQQLLRETYDHGDAAAILLYDKHRGVVILVRQFRYAVYAKGDPAHLVEVCAGLLDGDDAQTCARREAEEETGYRVKDIVHVFDCYPSPGSLTEKIHCFVGAVDASARVAAGGGLAHEGEDIEVLELPFEKALGMIRNGEIIDAKTIALLQHAALDDLFGYQARD